ncbi:MAG: pseudouridine synthase [Alphaproteobacteria bacterium]
MPEGPLSRFSRAMAETSETRGGERIAKVIARAGLCSRREAEAWIAAGRVSVDGETLRSPATFVDDSNEVLVDGEPLPARERPRLWRYHKPKGLITTRHDPQGRPTIFESLPKGLPRVISVGRLDLTSEGLLLLTNDGALARSLELPSSGWTRRYRVRAFGTLDPKRLEALAHGITIDGVRYGPITAALDRSQGRNHWLTLTIREGKNREVRRVCEHLGLTVNRLIRVAFGPFQLGELAPGEVREVPLRVLREQLGAEAAARLAPSRRASHARD